VFLLEASYFSYILTHKNSDQPSDVILVFMGSEKRVATGYALAGKGLSPGIVLSPATDRLRRYYNSKYALKDAIDHIPEEAATTTFENALYTSRIIKDRCYKNIILVTSDYHMPRSLALLRLFLAGKDVRVHLHLVHAADAATAVNAVLPKLVYNEMVEFWGSLFEYAAYQLRGMPVEKTVKKSVFMQYLRSLVLLDVKPSW
jgi:uncharacterized SAM-binding protein YcdF (DUF218 family)